ECLAWDLAAHIVVSGIAEDANDLEVRRRLPPPSHQPAYRARAIEVLFDQSFINQAALLRAAPVGPGEIPAGFDRNTEGVEVPGRDGVLEAPRVVSTLWRNSGDGDLAVRSPARQQTGAVRSHGFHAWNCSQALDQRTIDLPLASLVVLYRRTGSE